MVPAVLALALDRTSLTAGSRALRFGYVAGAFALAWQWIGSLFLSGIYLLASRAWAVGAWKVPFFATFALPVFVFALILLDVHRMQQHHQAEGPGVRLVGRNGSGSILSRTRDAE
jgi:hypothetical protein